MHKFHFSKKNFIKKRKEKDFRFKKTQNNNLDNMKKNKRKSIIERNRRLKNHIIGSERHQKKLKKKDMNLNLKSLEKTKAGLWILRKQTLKNLKMKREKYKVSIMSRLKH